MKAWNAYFFGDSSSTRATLVARGFLLLLAVDIWVNMLESAGRYGVADFNVAHFDLLGALQPMPEPGLYVGTMALASFAAFVGAVTGPRRWLTAIALVTFTYGWAMSQLDSYQHHYLMSVMLACLLGIDTRDDASEEDHADEAAGWGIPLLCASIAVVYFFAAVSKTESAWLSGEALKRMMGSKAEVLLDAWQVTGASAELFWSMMGHSVVVIQLVLAAAYIALPLRERSGPVVKALIYTGFAAGIGFHLGAEWIELSIEWFSYYMVFFAVVLLGPEKPLEICSSVFERLTSRARETLEPVATLEVAVGIGTIAAIAVVVTTMWVDLPGASAAGTIAAITVIIGCVIAARAPEHRLPLLARSTAVALAAAGMLAVVAHYETRFDYYRYVGGDAYRRAAMQTDRASKLELMRTSLHAYRKANRHAPPDRDRVEKMKRVEEELRQLEGGS